MAFFERKDLEVVSIITNFYINTWENKIWFPKTFVDVSSNSDVMFSNVAFWPCDLIRFVWSWTFKDTQHFVYSVHDLPSLRLGRDGTLNNHYPISRRLLQNQLQHSTIHLFLCYLLIISIPINVKSRVVYPKSCINWKEVIKLYMSFSIISKMYLFEKLCLFS